MYNWHDGNKNNLRTIEAQIVQKLKHNEARPKFTGSYNKSVRTRIYIICWNPPLLLTPYSCSYSPTPSPRPRHRPYTHVYTSSKSA